MKYNNTPLKYDDKKNYCGIDFVKFVCALLIVTLHMSPLYDYGEDWNFIVTNGICRIGVPFFFISSGFFIFRRDNSCEKMYDRIKKIIKQYFIWMIIYFPHLCYTNGGGGVSGVLKTIYEFFLVGYVHLWYLQGMIGALIIMTLLLNNTKSEVIIFIVALICYVSGLLLFGYNGDQVILPVLGKVSFPSLFVGILYGVPYITMGYFLAVKPIKIQWKKACVLTIVFSALHIIEIIVLHKYIEDFSGYNMTIILSIEVFLLFYIVSHIKFSGFKKMNWREWSKWIYYSQYIYWFLYVIIKRVLSLFIYVEEKSIIRWFFVISTDVYFSLIIVRISEKKRFSKLKILIQ